MESKTKLDLIDKYCKDQNKSKKSKQSKAKQKTNKKNTLMLVKK